MPIQLTGQMPLFVALTLGAGLSLLIWRLYFPKSDSTVRPARSVLPLLRCAAVFVTVLLLTEPVWMTRRVEGELATVRVVIDTSESMAATDPHMSIGRKLQIADELDWLPDGVVDWTEPTIAKAVREDSALLAAEPKNEANVTQLVRSVEALVATVPPEQQEQLSTRVLEVLSNPERSEQDTLAAARDAGEAADQQIAKALERLKDEAQTDSKISAAASIFDESTRLDRISAAFRKDDSPLASIANTHRLEIVVVRDGEPTVSRRTSETGVTTDANGDFVEQYLPESDFVRFLESAGRPSGSEAGADAEPLVPAATVLLTDGRHNTQNSPLSASKAVAQAGGQLVTVGFGATEAVTDVAVVDLQAPDEVFAKDQITGRIRIRDHLREGDSFPVRIRHADTVVWERDVTASGDGDRFIDFAFEANAIGRSRETGQAGRDDADIFQASLVVEVGPVQGEYDVDNNSREFRVNVIADEQRVLIVDSRARWETRYIRNVFERDSRWSVNTVIGGPGSEQVELPRGDGNGLFPDSRDTLFEYDLIIVGELTPTSLTAAESAWVAEFVSTRGGGLIMIDGPRGWLHQEASPLRTLLPVRRQPDAVSVSARRLELTARGASEDAFRVFPDDVENREFWRSLPAPRQLARVEVEPGGEALLNAVTGNDAIAAVVQRRLGAGRILYFASDETWRWRYKVADLWHQRLWNQFARFAMPEPFAASSDFVQIDTDRVTYYAGDQIVVRTQLSAPDGSPAESAVVEALIYREGTLQSSVPLSADGTAPGLYRGIAGPLGDGQYEVRIRAAGYNDITEAVAAPFLVVSSPGKELADVSLNEALLREMASAGGGRYLPEEDLGELPDLLAPLSRGRVIESEFALGESYWALAVIVCLLAAEWILRKRSGLL